MTRIAAEVYWQGSMPLSTEAMPVWDQVGLMAEALPGQSPTRAFLGTDEPDSSVNYGEIIITPEREAYADGDLRLVIPALDLDSPVFNGTDEAALNKGPCLYEASALPGEGDRNVSIAAHRNGYKNGVPTESWFYYLDKLDNGDYLYLYDSENVYRYIYKSTVIVKQDDWRPIFNQGYSCLTLTTCTPIGIADHRIIVHGELDGTYKNLS